MTSNYNPNMEAGPYAYAQKLASYIACPSTIRVRTLEWWGRAPSLRQCKAYRDEVLRRRGAPEPKSRSEEPTDKDGLEFAVPGTVDARTIKPAPEPEPLLPPVPEIQSDWRVLVKVVAEHFGMTFADIVGRSRLAAINEARQLCYLLLYERGNSYPQIGRWLGGRDHQPVIHGCKVFHEKAKRSPRLMEAYEHFSAIGGKRR